MQQCTLIYEMSTFTGKLRCSVGVFLALAVSNLPVAIQPQVTTSRNVQGHAGKARTLHIQSVP